MNIYKADDKRAAKMEQVGVKEAVIKVKWTYINCHVCFGVACRRVGRLEAAIHQRRRVFDRKSTLEEAE